MRMRVVVVSAFALAILAAPRVATSQGNDIAKARKHTANATALYNAKRYVEAAEEYIAAYRAFPAIDLLFNIAQAYRQADMPAEALEYYQKYVAVAPAGDARVEASNKYIAELEAKLGKAKTDSDPGATGGEPDKPEPDKPEPDKPESDKPESDKPDGPTPLTPPPPPPVDTGGSWTGMRIAGLATVGGGVLALALAGKFASDVSSASAEIESTTEWTDERLALFDKGESAQTKMLASAGVGAALLVTGGVLYLLGGKSAERPGLAVTVDVSETRTIVGIGGRL